MMMPLMTVLFIQPTLIYFFYIIYDSNYELDQIIVISYVFLTIFGIYFALCIRSLRKIIKSEPQIVDNASYDKVRNLDDEILDVKLKY